MERNAWIAVAEAFLRRCGVLILLTFALLYYGFYYRAGLYPAAEGGVEGMIALRLLEGQRPIIDTFLGYNLLWFYPVVALFKIFGPSYTALRIFFFVLSTITGLLSFRLVRKATDSTIVALLTGLLVLVIPGQMFRNYMAFMVVLNMTVFLSAFVFPARTTIIRLLWMAACGISLAIAWLIRVDVGFFLTCIWLGLILIYPLRTGSSLRLFPRIGLATAGLLLGGMMFLLTHLPFYLDASRHGFAPEFQGQYAQWPAMIQFQGNRVVGIIVQSTEEIFAHHEKPPVLQKTTAPSSSIAPSSATPAVTNPVSKEKETQLAPTTLARRSLSASTARDRMLSLNLYLPVLLAGLLAMGSLMGWFIAFVRHDEKGQQTMLLLLTCLGCSLTLFPQYFFWRPDMVHLSEFMVPMTVTLILSLFITGRALISANLVMRIGLGGFSLLAVLTLLLYYINACQSQSSGGIAASVKKRVEFHGANGVNVLLTPDEFRDTSAIYRIITAVSAPGEYLVCYPYNPEINFMTDRPSYEYNFYIDNAMVSSEQFYTQTVAKIAKYHPVVFVITNWEINNTEESKFQNWAAKTYNYIASNYTLAYRHGIVEVFVRRDRATAIPYLK